MRIKLEETHHKPASYIVETHQGLVKNHQRHGYVDDVMRRILVDPEQTAEDLLGTYIHEFMHVLQPYLDEDEVDRVSVGLAKGLRRLGYAR